MNFQINEQAAAALSKRKKHNIYLFALSIAAVFTVIGVIIVLTRPGHAFSSLEKTLECQVEVHQHTADCYDAEGNLICGYADYVAHVHDPELCYDENGDLVCQLPEIIPHEHDDSCYLERMVLICGCEEGQVVDSQGNPVFDAEGKPVFDIADVPDVESISVEGDLTEDAAAEDAETIEGEEITEGEATEGEAVDAEAAETEASDTEATDTDAANAEVTDKDATNTEASDADVNGTEETESNGTESAEAANSADNTEKTDADVTVEDNKEKTDADVTAEDNKENTDNAEEAVNTEETVNTENTEEAVSTEETAPANAAETPANDEIITETVDLGQNAGTGEEEYSIHHHTAECYKIEKELICTIPTLHVHDSSCYDEEGNLICGQLQLTMHVHGEDCFHFEEKTVTQTAVAGDYTITATYGASAKIPSKAELRARIIDPESEEYAANIDAATEAAGENAEVEVLFDIGFYVNGEEIEPEGPVDITFTMNGEENAEGDEYSMLHIKEDGTVEVNDTILDENNEATITVDSFSIYGAAKKISGIEYNRQYDKYYLGLIGLDSDNNVEDFNHKRFTQYRVYENALGIGANFHIIAFNTFETSGTHINGNICVNKLISCTGNFGTTGTDPAVLPYEISYIRELPSDNGKYTNQMGTDGEGCAVVFGYKNKVTTNGSKIFVNKKEWDKPYSVYVEENENTPFINLNDLQKEMRDLSDDLAYEDVENKIKKKDQNTEKYDSNNDTGSYFKLTDPDVAGYLNLTVEQFKSYTGKNVNLTGFKKGCNGTLIINVDCGTMNEGDVLEINKSKTMYVDDQVHSYGHYTQFGDGKVIWNFFNSNGIVIRQNEPMCGVILAPDARIEARQNLDGQIIGNDVYVGGETHRVSFTGTTIPFKASFVATKKVAGQAPAADESFKFLLQEYNRSSKDWDTIDEAWNKNGSISFDTIKKYEKPEDKGYHYFRIIEDVNTACKNGKQYIFDRTEYYIVIKVELKGTTYTATTKYYKVSPGGKYVEVNGELSFSDSISDYTQMIFDNTPNVKTISAEKKWLDKNGNVMNNPPEKLDAYLFSTTNLSKRVSDINLDAFEKGTEIDGIKCVDIIDLATTEQKWFYEWNNLPSKDKNGKEIYYFVTEKPVPGFFGTNSEDGFVEKGAFILTNREEGTTFIEIDKDFVAYGFGGGENNLLVLDSPFINGIVNPDAYVTFRLTRKPTVDGVVGEEEPYTGTVLVNGEEVTGGVFKVKAGTNNDWKAIVEQLPAVSYENDTVTTYEYFVTETEDKSENVKVYKFLDMKVSLAGEGKDAHKVFTVRNLLGNTEFEIDKTWLTYTGSVMTTLQDNPSAEVVVPITIVQYNEDKTSFNDYGSYLLGAQSITDINGNTTNKAELIEDNASSTGKKLWAAKFTDLPAYYAEKQADGKVILKKYSYSAAEGVISGYALITEPIKDENGNVIASKLDTELTDFTYSNIVLVNQSNTTFSLPETGGAGRSIIPVYIAGAVVILSLIALLAYRKKLRRN